MSLVKKNIHEPEEKKTSCRYTIPFHLPHLTSPPNLPIYIKGSFVNGWEIWPTGKAILATITDQSTRTGNNGRGSDVFSKADSEG